MRRRPSSVTALALLLLSAGVAARAGENAGPGVVDESPSSQGPVSDVVEVDPAASVAEPAAEEKPVLRVMEEVIVTAQKREENVLSVPVSVQAFSASMLDARGITDQAGLMRSTPSLDVATQTGYTTLFLRGVGTDAFLSGDPSVASYVDGVYFPFTPSIVQDFGAVQRVEVLKGPQGTLFGRNAVAGAINTITRDPSFTEAETSLQAGYSNFDMFKSRIFTNVPLTDWLAVNASLVYSKGDSYFDDDSAVNGHPLDREWHRGGRAKVRFAPTDNLDFVVSGTYFEDEDNAALPSNFYVTPLGRALQIPAAEGRRVESDQPIYRHFRSRVLAAQGTYNAPGLDVKATGSHQQHVQDYIYDFDGSARPYISFSIGPGDPNGGLFAMSNQAELQLISSENSIASDWLKFNVGVYYYEGRTGLDPIRFTVANITSAGLAGFGAPSGLLDVINAVPLPPGLELPVQGGAPLYSFRGNEYTDTDSLSEYFQVTAQLSDRIALTLGGRYQREKREVPKSKIYLELRDGTEIQAYDWQVGRTGSGDPIPLHHTTKGFKPKVTLDVHPFDDDTLVFLTYQEAIKSATYNAFALYLPPEFVEPEEMKAYELGVKTRLFGGRMQLSAGTWWYDIENLQTQFVSLLNGGAVSFENAEKARSRGVDFDLTARLFEGLTLTLNGAYVDSKYVRYPNASGIVPESEPPYLALFSSQNDYSGKRMTRVPKYTASAGLSQTWQVGSGNVEAGADVYYNDGFYYAASNDPNFAQDAYTTLNARLSYLYEPWGLRASLYGANLADKLYTTGMIATDLGGNYTVAPGRTGWLRLDWEF